MAVGVRIIKILLKSIKCEHSEEYVRKKEYCRRLLYRRRPDCPTTSSLSCVTLNFHSGMCVTISNHRKVIKLWDTPRRKVRSSSSCFYTLDSLGTVAPWLIARDKTTHNKCHREGLPRAAMYTSPVCAVTWVSILSGNQSSPLSF